MLKQRRRWPHFSNVRFCLRYPADCKANPTENERIDLNAETSELLKRVNHSVNISIIPMPKEFMARILGDGWTIAPEMGDLQRLRRHQAARALESSLPSKALRCRWSRPHPELGISFLSLSRQRAPS